MKFQPNETNSAEAKEIAQIWSIARKGESVHDSVISKAINRPFLGTKDKAYPKAKKLAEQMGAITARAGDRTPAQVRLTDGQNTQRIAATPGKIRKLAKRNLRRLLTIEPENVTPEVHTQTTYNGLLALFSKPASVLRIGDLSKVEKKQLEPERVLEIFRK